MKCCFNNKHTSETNIYEIENLYHNLTGVDIVEQKKLWDERGKGYYGEFLVFEQLYSNNIGVRKFLMNLQLPVANGKFTEIDLLMIHETGLYVFEIKHYKGIIYGNPCDVHWTQFFKTRSNQIFNNPVKQNQFHINAIKKRYPDIPIYSFVVFTNSSCDLRINGSFADTTICLLNDLIYEFLNLIKNKNRVFDLLKIEYIFEDLKNFSPLNEETVVINNTVMPFYQFLDVLQNNYEVKIAENTKKVKKIKIVSILVCTIICSIISSIGYYQVFDAHQKLSYFAQKFKKVEEFNGGNLQITKDLVLIDDVVLKKSSDLDNAVDFSCTLIWNGSNYGVSIGEEAKIIVILKNGNVQEYNLWNNTYPFTSPFRLGASSFTQEGKISVHEFYDIEVSDISYIKLSNLGVFKKSNYSTVDVVEDYEIELYSLNK